MDTLLKRISSLMFVSSLIPATIFVTITVCFFVPNLPNVFFDQFTTKDPEIKDVLLFIISLSFFFAYLLTVAHDYIIRFYEGDMPIFSYFKEWLAVPERNRNKRLRDEVIEKEKEIRKMNPSENKEEFIHHWRQYIEMANKFTANFPDLADLFAPCRLGNIYRASEDFIFQKYGMESFFFWPRLTNVVPKDYKEEIDKLNETIAFHINTSLVSALLGIEIIVFKIILAGWQIHKWPLGKRWRLPIPLPQTDPTILIWLFGVVFVSWLFYRLAIATALTYGQYIRACYDLFRVDLLQALGVEPPEELGGEEERDLWQEIHEYLTFRENTIPQNHLHELVDHSCDSLTQKSN